MEYFNLKKPKEEHRLMPGTQFYAGWEYPIDPKICATCRYRNTAQGGLEYKCNYMFIVGHSRPMKNSTHDYCEAYEKGRPAQARPQTMSYLFDNQEFKEEDVG